MWGYNLGTSIVQLCSLVRGVKTVAEICGMYSMLVTGREKKLIMLQSFLHIAAAMQLLDNFWMSNKYIILLGSSLHPTSCSYFIGEISTFMRTLICVCPS